MQAQGLQAPATGRSGEARSVVGLRVLSKAITFRPSCTPC
jgi:hypothetical protein